MTREVKIGSAVAASFLSLVGVVVGTKMYKGDVPRPADTVIAEMANDVKDGVFPTNAPKPGEPGTLPSNLFSQEPLQPTSGFSTSPPPIPSVPVAPPGGLEIPSIPDVTKPFVDAGNNVAKSVEDKLREQDQIARNSVNKAKTDLTNGVNQFVDSGNKQITDAAKGFQDKATQTLNGLPGLPPGPPPAFPPPPASGTSLPGLPPAITVADNTIAGGAGTKPGDAPPPPAFSPSPPPPTTPTTITPTPPPSAPGLPEIPKGNTIIGGGPPPSVPGVAPQSNPLPPLPGSTPPSPPSPPPPFSDAPKPPTAPLPSDPTGLPKPAIETPPTTIVAPKIPDPGVGITQVPSTPIPSNPPSVPIVPGPPTSQPTGFQSPPPPTGGFQPPPSTGFQPNTPPAPAFTPSPTPPLTPPAPPFSATPTVRTDTPDRYLCQGNESYASVSARKYGSDGYARALEEYNRDFPGAPDNVRSVPARLTPGTVLWLPSKNHLQDRYRNYITAGSNLPPVSDRPLASEVGLNAPTPLSGAPANRPAVADAGTTSFRVPTGGMYLSQIAERQLGSPLRWIDIYRLNPGLQPEQPVREGIEIRMPTK